MTAFNPRFFSPLTEKLNETLGRLHATIDQPFTHDEVLMLFVPPEDHDFLRQARHKLQFNTQHPSFIVNYDPRFALWVELHDVGGHKFPLAPAKPEIQNSAPTELTARFKKWVEERYVLAVDMARTSATFKSLYQRCTSLAQMRYLFPSVLPILRMLEDTHGLADKAADFKAPRTLPDIPFGFRDTCRRASATVATALLLPEEAMKARSLWRIEKQVSIDIANPSRVTFPGIHGEHWPTTT